MIRTQIQLPEDEYERLREAARRQGRSMADCIREAIGLFLRVEGRPEYDISSLPAFHPRGVEDLKEHDRWWIESLEQR
ncbi:MAG: ribbon-helix-helix protein, CopG family [Candidatus Xenobia bacterium]